MSKSSISHKDTPHNNQTSTIKNQSGPLHKGKVKKIAILFQDAHARTRTRTHTQNATGNISKPNPQITDIDSNVDHLTHLNAH
jgi:DNA/RNA endonuclease YhcR with UshA esterase domain